MNHLLLALVAIFGAKVHTNEGPPLDQATILIENGRILAVGTDLDIPADAHRIDAQGLVLTPGLIDPWTQLGIVEISGIGHTRDSDTGQAGLSRAAYRVSDSYNPDSHVIPIQRAHGVTAAMVVPTGGLISGQTAVFNLGAQAPLLPSAGLVASLGGGEGHARGHRFALLRTLFDDALFYGRSRAAYIQNRLRPLAASALDLEAIYPAAKGQKNVFVRVNRRSDIRAAVRWAREKKVRIVLVGAREAWREAELLAREKVPVILDPVANAPSNFDALGTRMDPAVPLEEAGVRYAFSTFSTHQVRKLRQWAGNAVREGLSHAAALKAVTQRPAEFIGLVDHGRIAPGCVADLVLWTGDPFEFSSEVVSVFVAGEKVSKNHRQRALFEKYRHVKETADPPHGSPAESE